MGYRVRTGIIGLGYMGSIHLQKILNNRDAVLTAVYDTDHKRYSLIKDKRIRCCDNILEFPKLVDAVVIASPSTTHYSYLRLFLEQDIHCLCEKPPSLSERQLIKLIYTAKKNRLTFNVVMPERANPLVKKIISDVSCNGLAFFFDRISIFSSRSNDISVLFDLMIHDIDILVQLIPSRIKRISASGLSLLTKDIDTLNVRIEYENRRFAILNASRIASNKKRDIRVFYRDGYFSADLIKREYRYASIYNGQIVEKIKDFSRSDYDSIDEIDKDFINSVKLNKQSLYSAQTLLPVMQICDRIKKRIVRLDHHR